MFALDRLLNFIISFKQHSDLIATPTVQGTSNSRTTILPQNCNQKLKPEME